MSKKISKERLEQIINQVREETKNDIAERIHEIYGNHQDDDLTAEQFIIKLLPKLLSRTFAIGTLHAKYIIHDVLSELDLLDDH